MKLQSLHQRATVRTVHTLFYPITYYVEYDRWPSLEVAPTTLGTFSCCEAVTVNFDLRPWPWAWRLFCTTAKLLWHL